MNADIPHPSKFISEDVAEQLRNAGYDAENLRTLHEKQLSAIFDRNWFNMFVPQRFGGLAWSLPEIVRTEEGISWADGSSGWVVTLCSGAAWFCGFLDPVACSTMFNSQYPCVAGSGAVNGTADRTAEGFEINGLWPYATGSMLATVFTANCLVRENGVQVYDSEESPLVKSFLLMADEVKIHRTWHAMGMVATGSHSFEVKNTTIPENRSFIIDANCAVLSDNIFLYPFRQLAESTLTANLSGLAIRFLDLADARLRHKNYALSQRKIEESRISIQHARNVFYHSLDNSWNNLATRHSIPDEVLSHVTVASRQLVDCCATVVATLYPYCGLDAADTTQEINRVWRNFYTAIQHNLFRSFTLQAERHNLR
jgi:indole-3-acetate monooxygenase